MSHYEQRLERDLGVLQERIKGMSDMVQRGLADAVHALQKGDHQLAASTILADHPINRTMREIDAACHAFIAVHLPSGKHLRLLSSVIRVSNGGQKAGSHEPAPQKATRAGGS